MEILALKMTVFFDIIRKIPIFMRSALQRMGVWSQYFLLILHIYRTPTSARNFMLLGLQVLGLDGVKVGFFAKIRKIHQVQSLQNPVVQFWRTSKFRVYIGALGMYHIYKNQLWFGSITCLFGSSKGVHRWS